MRKINFINGEYYHIFNRGVDKRMVFGEEKDLRRFFQSMTEFNVVKPIGSIYENFFRKKRAKKLKFGNSVSKFEDKKKLVNFTCYCLNPNHYHFILEQLVEKGIEKFMHRLGVGYTKYFNEKYDRSGALFQGAFKATHTDSNEYLLHLSAYVNLNNRVHQLNDELGNRVSKLGSMSSWNEYLGNGYYFCKKDIILNQFKEISEYKKFAENSLKMIREKKGIEKLLLE